AGLGLGRGLLVLAPGLGLLGVGLALAGLGHGLGLLLVRPEDHHHVAAVLPRVGLDEPVLRDVLRHALQELDAPLGTGLLTTAEADDDLHLVAAVEELLDVATLGLVVVRVDLEAHPNFLLDRVRLVLPSLAGLQVGFVPLLAVI